MPAAELVLDDCPTTVHPHPADELVDASTLPASSTSPASLDPDVLRAPELEPLELTEPSPLPD